MKYNIFISYAHKDLEQVKSIKTEMERTLDVSCLMHMDNLEDNTPIPINVISHIEN